MTCCDCDYCGRRAKFWQAKSVQFNKSKTFRRNRSRRFISAEVEVASLQGKSGSLAKLLKAHGSSTVDDGSLPDTGFEINTAPAQGDRYVAQVQEMCRALRASKARVNKACGLHVHVDARDFTLFDLRRLVFLYEKIEPALFEVIAPSRRNNRYCQPCGPALAEAARDAKTLPETKAKLWPAVFDGDSVRGKKRQRKPAGRYKALNLHSWLFRGTVECRMHQGTVRAENIVHWGKLWAGILDYAYQHTERDIRALVGAPMDLLLAVAPDRTTRTWIKKRYRAFRAPLVGEDAIAA